MNQFLLAISYIGEPAIPRLRELRAQVGRPQEYRWWMLALGMAGDEAAAEELRTVVTEHPDRYARWVAVRAYTRAAGQDAVLLLESLLEDTTESEYGGSHGEKVLLIRNAAQSALHWLREEAEGRPAGEVE